MGFSNAGRLRRGREGLAGRDGDQPPGSGRPTAGGGARGEVRLRRPALGRAGAEGSGPVALGSPYVAVTPFVWEGLRLSTNQKKDALFSHGHCTDSFKIGFFRHGGADGQGCKNPKQSRHAVLVFVAWKSKGGPRIL